MTFTEFLFHVTFVYLVPASKVVIFDDAGNRISDIAGPFNEDSSVNLTCDSEGGKIQSKQIIIIHFLFTNNIKVLLDLIEFILSRE